MILIMEESSEVITFENTRNGKTFDAWLKEGTATEWVVTRRGSTREIKADILGHAQLRDEVWLGYAGTLPDTPFQAHRSRDDAFAWITDDGTAVSN